MKFLATFVLMALFATSLPAAIPAPQPSSNGKGYAASSEKPHKRHHHRHRVDKHRK